ncbi:FecR domain-containing protein [Caulobacter segnis]|uniref:FecR family protein n=1 Tax=Caulobacter segnis TaxID=88688 RepID=UPI00240FAF9D|nr:FecR domain-containing protein [Caulobacter segnis]MDG2520718.1 FecR domain-containing protein [Caulobacter segnis]
MSNPSNPIDAAAADWVVRRDRGLSAAETAELEAWLAADPRQRGAFVRAEAAWMSLDRGRALDPSLLMRQPMMARRGLLIGGGAALAAGLASVTLSPLLVGGKRIATGVGEGRRVPLEDGSSLDLNTDSKVKVRFDRTSRQVDLSQGEVWFEVSRDAARPFRVDVGLLALSADEADFSVRRDVDRVRVNVERGAVRLQRLGLEASERLVEAGAVAVADLRGVAVSTVAPAVLQANLAWRTGAIVLDGVTLAEAAAEFNRYNARAITVGEAARELRVVGVFRAREPEAFARAAAASLAVGVQVHSDAIYIG